MLYKSTQTSGLTCPSESSLLSFTFQSSQCVTTLWTANGFRFYLGSAVLDVADALGTSVGTFSLPFGTMPQAILLGAIIRLLVIVRMSSPYTHGMMGVLCRRQIFRVGWGGR